MLTQHTYSVLIALGVPWDKFQIGETQPGQYKIVRWEADVPQPSVAQINRYAANEIPLPSGQLFSQWLAENGGDKKATCKKILRNACQDNVNHSMIAVRALLDVIAAKMKLTATEVTQLKKDFVVRMQSIVDEGA